MLRKWMVRGLVFSIVGAIACAAWVYQRWTNPTAVRQHVIDHLTRLFPGASVSLDSARLRLLGGISLSELRLTRKDDADHTELLHVPSAVLYHDKEQLLDGTLVIRKVELHKPRLRVLRTPDGKWNVDGLIGPAGKQELLPTIVIHDGTLVFEDRFGGVNLPAVEIGNVSLTLVNDPLPSVAVLGTATSDTLGTLHMQGTWNRNTHDMSLKAEANGVVVGPALVQRLAATFPKLPLAQTQLEGKADVQVELAVRPRAPDPLTYAMHCTLTEGKVRHPQLCLPLDDLEVSAYLSNGHVRLNHL